MTWAQLPPAPAAVISPWWWAITLNYGLTYSFRFLNRFLWVFFPLQQEKSDRKVVMRSVVIAVINLTVWLPDLYSWFEGGCERVWKHSLGNPLVLSAELRAPLENKNPETVNVWTVDHEVPEGNKDSSGRSQGTICVIFGQESSFVLPVFLRSGLEFKCNGLICLVEEISRQEKFQFRLLLRTCLWVLVRTPPEKRKPL